MPVIYNEQTQGDVKHREKQKNKETYVDLCEKGNTYLQVMKKMNISEATLTKYALETNTIPSIHNFDRQQLYQLLHDLEQTKRNHKHAVRKHQKAMAEKNKRTYDPDFFLS